MSKADTVPMLVCFPERLVTELDNFPSNKKLPRVKRIVALLTNYFQQGPAVKVDLADYSRAKSKKRFTARIPVQLHKQVMEEAHAEYRDPSQALVAILVTTMRSVEAIPTD